MGGNEGNEGTSLRLKFLLLVALCVQARGRHGMCTDSHCARALHCDDIIMIDSNLEMWSLSSSNLVDTVPGAWAGMEGGHARRMCLRDGRLIRIRWVGWPFAQNSTYTLVRRYAQGAAAALPCRPPRCSAHVSVASSHVNTTPVLEQGCDGRMIASLIHSHDPTATTSSVLTVTVS